MALVALAGLAAALGVSADSEAEVVASEVVAAECRAVEVQVGAGNFLNKVEEQKLVRLIAAIERKTTAEVRVHLAKIVSKNGVLEDTKLAFQKIGMHKTPDRNGFLLYIATLDHQVACYGDEGIIKALGKDAADAFWNDCIEELVTAFKKGDQFLGIQYCLEKIGGLLEKHFPASDKDAENPNHLSDEISKD